MTIAASDNNGRQTQVMDKPLLKPKQVAEHLGISVKTVHVLCRAGKLDFLWVNGKERGFTWDMVQDFIEHRTVRRPNHIDKKPSWRLPCPSRGGESEKSVGFSRNDLREEIRSLCQ